MTLKWIDIKRAGPQEEIDGQEVGAASLLIGSSEIKYKGGPDFLEVSGGLEHCAKIAPRSIADAEKLIEWLKGWIAEQLGDGADEARPDIREVVKVWNESERLAAAAGKVAATFEEAVGEPSGIPIVHGFPHDTRTVFLPEFGGYFWAEEYHGRWSLFGCEQGDYEKGGRESEGAYDLTAPEDQAFLDVINARLFTNFRYEDFAGR